LDRSAPKTRDDEQRAVISEAEYRQGDEASNSRKARSPSPYRTSVKIPSSIRGTRPNSLALTTSNALLERIVTCSTEIVRLL
jgi:hypothetical protein